MRYTWQPLAQCHGTCILHVSPESHLGGTLALVQTGDEIELDVANRSLHWHVTDEEFAKRRAAWIAPKSSGLEATTPSSPSTSPKPTSAAISTS